MKKKISILFLFLMLLTVFSPMMKVFALEEGQIELTEIVINGDIQTESLEPGVLPSFTVTTTTPHVSIEAYGSNTGWAYLENGTWHGFGGETPTAVENGPFYAMRLKVDLSDGYVFTENTKLIYNDRDMIGDTFSSIDPFDWGGYVYVDLGQIIAPGPDVEGNVIKRVNIDVDMPRVGDTITVNNGVSSAQTLYSVIIPEESLNLYGPDGDDTHYYMYIVDENGELYDGKLEENTYYDMIIRLAALDDYIFDDNVEIYVNGEHITEYYLESNNILDIDYLFQPAGPDITYTISTEDNEYIATFELPEGFTFELSVTDILKYTPEQIEEMFDVPAETITEIIETIKNNVKDYGELISLYAISIDGPGYGYSDAVTLKILMTDEMKKYNTFKFLFLDENNNFVIQEVHDADSETEIIDGKEYIVFHLDHLSAYALVGSNTNNPGTADKVIYYMMILFLSTVGLAGLGVYTKKAYFNK